ncbi:hypothetical protein [Estrella lausannensis]|uniref:Putative secreted protein n=1 Tax=Estrella lausannensis TaxID=483423 RepID=A0A0H5DUD3_9BACT|nr:hypothetical protein [Estrella lausannensis]CRX39549.1 putative secreted protein [Estrella lausannensis]
MYINLLLLFALLSFPPALFGNEELPDLESNLSDFVREVKKIEVPGYPHAFNPSIIRWKGKILLSFRYLPDLKNKFLSCIGLMFVDENFESAGDPYILPLKLSSGSFPSRAEDGRLLYVGEKLMLVYSDCKDVKVSRGGFRVYITELLHNGSQFEIGPEICLNEYPQNDPSRREKNWVPFDYNGELMLSYSITPHTVFHNNCRAGRCDFISTSNKAVDWSWGELRGGTPGLLLDDNRYLSFFHSWIDMPSVHSQAKVSSHYFMGAYTYAADPPFDLLECSPEPIVGTGFYHGESYTPYWKPVVAIFPCGFLMDSNFVWVVYGRQDHEMWVVKLDKKPLLDSLKTVN